MSTSGSHGIAHEYRAECAEYYCIVRDQIHHEDDLINHRLSWLMLSESIFFGFYVNLNLIPHGPSTKADVDGYIIALLGILTCIFIWISIGAALRKIKDVSEKFSETCSASTVEAPSHSFPMVMSDDKTHNSGFVAARFVPASFLVGWLALLASHIVFRGP
jgi:hypothetical protein